MFLPLQKPTLVAQNNKTFRPLSTSFSQTHALKFTPRHFRTHFRWMPSVEDRNPVPSVARCLKNVIAYILPIFKIIIK